MQLLSVYKSACCKNITEANLHVGDCNERKTSRMMIFICSNKCGTGGGEGGGIDKRSTSKPGVCTHMSVADWCECETEWNRGRVG